VDRILAGNPFSGRDSKKTTAGLLSEVYEDMRRRRGEGRP
jgi:hypothetical protein